MLPRAVCLSAPSPSLPRILVVWASPPFWECDVSSLVWSLDGNPCCRDDLWESSHADHLPSTIPCWLRSVFPCCGQGERCSPRNLALTCLGFCRPSSDACLHVPPQGLVGLLHFYPSSIPLPELCLLSLASLAQSSVTTCTVVPILQNQQEQDRPEKIQGTSKRRDLPSGFLWLLGGTSQVWN